MTAPKPKAPSPVVAGGVSARPDGVWRVCGQPVTAGAGGGCTCHGAPDRWQSRRALDRLTAGAQ